MRVVIDTNVAISGLLWHGKPRGVLEQARSGVITIFSSPALLDELADVLIRPHLATRVMATGLTPAQLFQGYQALVEVIVPPAVPKVILADPDDDAVLACAAAIKANAIISGDQHLLELGSYQGIEIYSAAELVRRMIL